MWVPEMLVFTGDKTTGPTFYDEVESYGGLMGEHWTRHQPGWFLDPQPAVAFEFFEDTPQEVVDGVLAVYEAHDPTKLAHPEDRQTIP